MIEQTEQILAFQKATMLGNITYKRVTTTVSILNDVLEVKKTTKKFFRKEKFEQRTFAIAEITAGRIRTVFDFWDTLYAIIFALASFVNPICFVVALICLWCGYGKMIEISIKTGERYEIPVKGSKEEANILLNICNISG